MFLNTFRAFFIVIICIQSAYSAASPRFLSYFLPTIHGAVEIHHPVLHQIVESEPMKRAYKINQYGACVCAFPLPGGKTYTRGQHMLGVLYILQHAKKSGAIIALSEEIAGLCHDLPHTVFSHSTDPLLTGGFKESFHDTQHKIFFEKHGFGKWLAPHHLAIDDILPDNPRHRALETSLPDLCADRIEYILHEGYLSGLLTPENHQKILKDLTYDNYDGWYFTSHKSARIFADISIHGTLNVWSSKGSLSRGYYTSEALRVMLDRNLLTRTELEYDLTDDVLWQRMLTCDLPEIQTSLPKIMDPNPTPPPHIKGKMRVVNPWIQKKGKRYRLIDQDPDFKKKYQEAKLIIEQK